VLFADHADFLPELKLEFVQLSFSETGPGWREALDILIRGDLSILSYTNLIMPGDMSGRELGAHPDGYARRVRKV
jgi:hypothetical protein